MRKKTHHQIGELSEERIIKKFMNYLTNKVHFVPATEKAIVRATNAYFEPKTKGGLNEQGV